MHTLNSCCYGDPIKPALVLLHGFMGELSDWQAVIEQLKDDYYCIALDLPGHGGSTACVLTPEAGFAQSAALIFHTLEQLGVRRYSMLGYSLGGRVALYYALLHLLPPDNITPEIDGVNGFLPHQLDQLILESANPFTEADAVKRLEHDRQWAQRFCHHPLDETLALWYQQAVFSDLTSAQQQRLINRRLLLGRDKGAAWGNAMVALSVARQPDYGERLLTRANFHYLYGQSDKKYRQFARRLNREYQTTCVGFAHCGHNIHFQQPELFCRQLRQIVG